MCRLGSVPADLLNSHHSPELGMNPSSRSFYGFLRLHSDSLPISHTVALEEHTAPP